MNRFDSAVILAGGESTRMGFDKQLLYINKTSIINYLAEQLKNAFSDIIIVTNTPEYYKNSSCKIVSDQIKSQGPLCGIHSGLIHASSHYVYVIACDMPIINLDYITYMKRKLEIREVDACITRYREWIEPFNAFYSKRLINAIECYLLSNNKSIFDLVKNMDCIYIKEKEARFFSPHWEMFINLNNKKDLDKFSAILSKRM
ncbi:molybdenum cofactor guanylyltransferase [Vallitalea okinawensis]|uniref:molybdenum cofactor guanylyltransferase n=1 Tax=Vallitalea okinawensis TaxID=2078660 RepID=UPI000CFC542B|nr:molybdenum cofactor guanylyltransferase [Vallitalea okinawensis]